MNAEAVAEATKTSLSLCILKLIPSIFPFMVLSTILMKRVECLRNADNLDKCKISKITIVLSWISGFLTGSKFISESGTEEDVTGLIFLTSNAGVGFVVSYVGMTLWQSFTYGIYLYVIQVFTSLFIYLVSTKGKQKIKIKSTREPILTSISSAILNSTRTVVDICGCTLFFSIVKSVSLNRISSEIGKNFLASLLEITSGTYVSVLNESNLISSFFTGFAVGFGGICICMQTFTVCHSLNINKMRFMVLKLFQGIACGILSLVFVKELNIEPIKQTSLLQNIEICTENAVIFAIFLCSVMVLLKKFLKNKIYSL